jgi:inosine/xanthosine triphosphatase
MLSVVICSENPVKILAAKEAFTSFFENLVFKTINLDKYNSISKQPMSTRETLESAVNRVEIAQNLEKGDFYVSMEGGVAKDDYGAFLTWYVCVSNISGENSVSGGGRMPLPLKIYDELSQNKEIELGNIMDRIADEKNVKQKGGSTAIFTGNRIQRKDVFKREIIIALVPFTSKAYKELERKS